MRILVVHNRYAQHGGEDVVYKAEADLLENYGHTVERLEFHNDQGKSAWEKFKAVCRMFHNSTSAKILSEKIREFKPDVIHVHNFFFVASPAVFEVAHRMKVPIVMTLHNYRLICPSTNLHHSSGPYERGIGKLIPLDAILKGMYRDSIVLTAMLAAMTAWHHLTGTWKKKVDRYIVLSSFGLERFARSGRLPMNKVVLKPNFVKDPIREGETSGRRAGYFLFVGRLVREKGLEVLLGASQLYHFRVVIIGDGPMRSVVEDHARSNQNIEYLGFQGTDVIIDHLKKCKALLFPSLFYECFPMTILEAYSTGTPVITSRRGSMKEIVYDRVTGLHFEAGNQHDLAAKIAMIDSPANHCWVAPMYQATRELYLERFTPRRCHDRLMTIYEEAIADKTSVKPVPVKSAAASYNPGRRAAVLLLAGTVLGLGFTFSKKWRGVNGWTAALARPKVLYSVGGTTLINEIGKAYADANPSEASARVLIDKLFNKAPDPEKEIKAGVLPYWMERKSKTDFENGKTLVIRGWVISVTEARQCALYHINDSRI